MTLFRTLIFGLLALLFHAEGLAQTEDSLTFKLTEIVKRSMAVVPDLSECGDIKLTMSAVIVVFSRRSEVEEIIFSKSPKCLYDFKLQMAAELRMRIKELAIPSGRLSNSYIVFLRLPGAMEENLVNLEHFPENRDSIFEGIDTQALRRKDLRYLIPFTIRYFPRTEN